MKTYLFILTTLMVTCTLTAGELVLRNGKKIQTKGTYEVKKNFVVYRDKFDKLVQLPLKFVDLESSNSDSSSDLTKTIDDYQKEANELHKKYIKKVTRFDEKKKSENSFKKIIESNTNAFGSASSEVTLERTSKRPKDYSRYRKKSKSQLANDIYWAIYEKDIVELKAIYQVALSQNEIPQEHNSMPFAFQAIEEDFRNGFDTIIKNTHDPHIAYEGHTLVTAILTKVKHRESFSPKAYLLVLAKHEMNLTGRSFNNYYDFFTKSSYNNKEARGHNALTYAIFQNDDILLKTLLEAGANVSDPGIDDKYPIFYAIEKQQESNINLLISYDGHKVKHMISEYTPVEYAIRHGQLEYFKLLYDKSKNSNFHSLGTRSPLLFAMKVAREDLLYELQFILKDELKQDDFTKFMWQALEQGSKSGITFALSMGANIENRNALGDTLLLHAVKKQDAFMVKFLLDNGANKMAKTPNGKTPLELAKTFKNESTIKFLKSSP